MRIFSYILALGLAVFMFVLGISIMVTPNVMTEVCHTESSNSWAFIPMFVGTVITGVTALAAWDDR